MKKNILLFAVALFGACLFAQVQASENQLEMAPSKIKEIDSEKAVVEFKTDISNVEVYLNKTFYGYTNLEVTDLLPGVYSVELKLAGYETQCFLIHAKKGYAQTYSFEMKLIQGTISLFNVPEASKISVDETEIISSYTKNDSGVIYTVPGVHKITIKCFGYADFEREVEVKGYEDFSVQIEMSPANFELSSLNAVKDTFNPDYKGRLGSCVFNFKVTNNNPVLAEIFDAENKVVWSKELGHFETWEQSFSWDGKSLEGKTLDNGEYVVKLTGGSFVEQTKVTISRSVEYPLFNANVTGSGIGPLPSVFGSQFNYCAVYLNAAPTTVTNLKESLENQKTDFYGLGLNAGVIWNFADHYELGAQAFTLPGYEETFVGRMNISFKAYNSFALKNDITCSYGGLLRVGFATTAIYEPYGIDNGSGLIGPCGMIGFSKDKWSTCFSSQFIYSACTGSFKNNDCVWKNAVSGTYKPVKSLGLNAWLGLNSAIKVNSVTGGSEPGFIFARGLNYGAGLTWLAFSSTILVNLNVDGNVIFGEANYLSCQFGLSYLF